MREMTLEERKQTSLNILKNIDATCNKLGIRYYLAYGTLIGAVRHKGFIPWDDDIDIWIPIKDYDSFIAAFNNTDYEIIDCYSNENWPRCFSKISDKRTIIVDNDLADNQLHRGVSVDVFPIFNCDKNDKYWEKNILDYKKNINRLWNHRNGFFKKNILKNLIMSLYAKYQILIGKDIMFLKKKLKEIQINQKSTGYIGCILSPYGRKDVHEEECFSSTVVLQFEDAYFCAPVGWDKILSNIYDNYMELPPVEKQITNHNVKVYWR